jgi:hypothetical protein
MNTEIDNTNMSAGDGDTATVIGAWISSDGEPRLRRTRAEVGAEWTKYYAATAGPGSVLVRAIGCESVVLRVLFDGEEEERAGTVLHYEMDVSSVVAVEVQARVITLVEVGS